MQNLFKFLLAVPTLLYFPFIKINITSNNNVCQIEYKDIKNPFIILIGISTFDEKQVLNKYEQITNLKGVKVDMKELSDLFTKYYNCENVRNIQNYIKKSNKHNYNDKENNSVKNPYFVKRKQIMNFLNECRIQIRKRKNIDSLMVYYSGHGFERDFTIDSSGKIFSLYEIKYELRDVLTDKPKLYFFDCCRNLELPQIDETEMKNTQFKGTSIRKEWSFPLKCHCDFQNILTLYATADGKGIFEHPEHGSRMRRAITKYFNNKPDSLTLHQLLLWLKDEIQKDNKYDKNIQTPEVSDFVTKEYNLTE